MLELKDNALQRILPSSISGDYGKGGNFGGSGGYDSQYVAVTAGQSYTITVGAAGGSNGSAGFVLIAYGGDI